MLRSSLYVLLVLLTCAILLVRRIRAMRRAQSELRRRETQRSERAIEKLSEGFLALHITCEDQLTPALNEVAKAFEDFGEKLAIDVRKRKRC